MMFLRAIRSQTKESARDDACQQDVPEAARPVQETEEETGKHNRNRLAEFSEQARETVAAINTFLDEWREEHIRNCEWDDSRAERGKQFARGDVIPNILETGQHGGEDIKIKQGKDNPRDSADEHFTPKLLTISLVSSRCLSMKEVALHGFHQN